MVEVEFVRDDLHVVPGAVIVFAVAFDDGDVAGVEPVEEVGEPVAEGGVIGGGPGGVGQRFEDFDGVDHVDEAAGFDDAGV